MANCLILLLFDQFANVEAFIQDMCSSQSELKMVHYHE
jgi:hypothetical protein